MDAQIERVIAEVKAELWAETWKDSDWALDEVAQRVLGVAAQRAEGWENPHSGPIVAAWLRRLASDVAKETK